VPSALIQSLNPLIRDFINTIGHKQTFTPSLGQVRFAPRKRTSVGAVGMSALCQERTLVRQEKKMMPPSACAQA
jgi:hypothetical protein